MVLGIATAFEDFDKNTLGNLRKLASHGEVIGETFHALSQQGVLKDWRLPYQIPFPLAMDKLIKQDGELSEDTIAAFIDEQLPNFGEQPPTYREKILAQVRAYLQKLDYHAQTFEMYNLKGTPSHILVDKQGILRECVFGSQPELEKHIQDFLLE